MEIKQGDMVSVLGHYLAMMITDGIVHNALNNAKFVVDNIDREGRMAYVSCKLPISLQSPIAHLVKVDSEAKEANVKIGDKVVVHYPSGDRIGRIQEIMLDGTYDIDFGGECTGHNITRSQIEPYTTPIIKVGDRVRSKGYALEAVVLGIDGDYIAVRRDDGIKQEWKRYMTELVEPTEQTEAVGYARIRQMEAELDKFVKAELDRILHPEKPTFEVTIDNVAMNWQRYEADLAKELAIAYGKRGKSPLDAVAAAKEITKRLKKK